MAGFRSFGFKVRRVGKLKRAPAWGDAVVTEIMNELASDRTVGITRELDRVVANWTNKPSFKVRVAYNYKPAGRFYGGAPFKKGDITLGYRVLGTRKAQEIFNWVNLGTRPHKIRAKNAPRLAFMWGGPGSYKAKTTPGGRSLKFGGPGAVVGGTLHRPMEVNHPGTEPRDIDGYIQRKVQTKFKRAIQTAVKRGISRANQRYGAIKAQVQAW